MRKKISVILVAALSLAGVVGFTTPSFASDWDKAGKILTGLEGVRILTGGRFDLIGNMFKINKEFEPEWQTRVVHRHKNKNKVKQHYCTHRTWVPHYVWKKKYVPRHTEYDDRYGEVIVEGHYIKYQVEQGGKWITTCRR